MAYRQEWNTRLCPIAETTSCSLAIGLKKNLLARAPPEQSFLFAPRLQRIRKRLPAHQRLLCARRSHVPPPNPITTLASASSSAAKIAFRSLSSGTFSFKTLTTASMVAWTVSDPTPDAFFSRALK